MERKRTATATATGLYDSFCYIFFFLHCFSLHLFVSQKSLNDEERGGNCLLVPERSYGPASELANSNANRRRTEITSIAQFCADGSLAFHILRSLKVIGTDTDQSGRLPVLLTFHLSPQRLVPIPVRPCKNLFHLYSVNGHF